MKKVKMLKRQRINRALKSIFNYPYTIVEAPIGYGKTTAVKEFLKTEGNNALWISLLVAEETTSFFWNEFANQLGLLDEVMGDRLRSLGFPLDVPHMAKILSMLNDIDYEEKTVLVIDDYHLVKSSQISEFISQIVKEQLNNFHIVVITRDTTNLDFPELAFKGLCNIISQQLLRFTDEEIRAYCFMMGRMPDEEELIKISEYSGGWISLIYLILLGLENGIPVGMNSTIDELLERTLYNSYDERIKQFLLKLALMDQFTAKQALEVTRESRTDELLKKLYRENAFVGYDEKDGVYKIHNVLIDFLRLKQRFDSSQLHDINKRIGEWYLRQKELVAAYTYLYRAGEVEYILSLLNNEDIISNELADFEGSFEMFASTPRELLFKYPLAYLQYICLILLYGNDELMQDGVKRLDELEQFYMKGEYNQDHEKKRILAEIRVIRIFSVFNDAQKMIDCTNEAVDLFEGGHSCLLMRESEFTLGSPHFLYSYYKEAGRLKETVDIMVRGFPAFAKLADGCGTGSEYLTLAEYALETGDLQGAGLNAVKAIYKAKTKEQIGIIICANFTLIRLYIIQGKIAEGMEILQQVRREVDRENNAIHNTAMEMCEGYIYGCLGQVNKIPVWLQTGDMSPAKLLYQGLAFNYLVYSKAVLLSKNYLKLEMIVESCAEYFSVFNNQLAFIHNHIYEAVAKYNLYGMAQGKSALQKALVIGQADNIIMPFAENAPVIFDMLTVIFNEDKNNEYFTRVYHYCKQYIENLRQIEKDEVSLSSREKEVLYLAAEGLKRDDIAQRLSISPGTIKKHLQNIYQKLEVSSRTAAIRKANELKLF